MNPNPILFLVAFLLMSAPVDVLAQQPPAQLPPVAHDQVLSANVLGVVAKWFNVEYERKVSEAYTTGISGSALVIDEFDGSVRRVNAFARYYPQRSALNGFYLGVRGGVLWNWVGEAGGVPTAGVELGKTVLYGPNQNISLSIGFGLDRAWYKRESAVVPNVRFFNIGVAF